MEPNEIPKPFPWPAAIIASAVVVVAAFALTAFLKSCQRVDRTAEALGDGVKLVGKAIDKAPEIASRFMTGRITHTFRESIPQIASTQGDVLELAVSRGDETFSRSNEKRIGWDYVYLGTTVAEIRAPVTFRYHCRLSDTWRLATRGQVCIVLAPRIRPSLPPAIHTDGMEKRAESGWARFDKDAQLAELESDLTRLLSQRAMDPSHLALVRESCRQSVAAFVRTWLIREEQWKTNRFTSIIVLFPDEAKALADEDLLEFQREPTLKLE